MYLDTFLNLMLSVFMSIQITVDNFIAEYITLKIISYSLGGIRVVFTLLRFNGGDGVMMDINTVAEKRDTQVILSVINA